MGDLKSKINPIKNIIRYSPVRPNENNSSMQICPISGRKKLFYSIRAIYDYLPNRLRHWPQGWEQMKVFIESVPEFTVVGDFFHDTEVLANVDEKGTTTDCHFDDDDEDESSEESSEPDDSFEAVAELDRAVEELITGKMTVKEANSRLLENPYTGTDHIFFKISAIREILPSSVKFHVKSNREFRRYLSDHPNFVEDQCHVQSKAKLKRAKHAIKNSVKSDKVDSHRRPCPTLIDTRIDKAVKHLMDSSSAAKFTNDNSDFAVDVVSGTSSRFYRIKSIYTMLPKQVRESSGFDLGQFTTYLDNHTDFVVVEDLVQTVAFLERDARRASKLSRKGSTPISFASNYTSAEIEIQEEVEKSDHENFSRFTSTPPLSRSATPIDHQQSEKSMSRPITPSHNFGPTDEACKKIGSENEDSDPDMPSLETVNFGSKSEKCLTTSSDDSVETIDVTSESDQEGYSEDLDIAWTTALLGPEESFDRSISDLLFFMSSLDDVDSISEMRDCERSLKAERFFRVEDVHSRLLSLAVSHTPRYLDGFLEYLVFHEDFVLKDGFMRAVNAPCLDDFKCEDIEREASEDSDNDFKAGVELEDSLVEFVKKSCSSEDDHETQIIERVSPQEGYDSENVKVDRSKLSSLDLAIFEAVDGYTATPGNSKACLCPMTQETKLFIQIFTVLKIISVSAKCHENFQSLRAHIKASPLYVLANSHFFNTKERLIGLPDEEELLKEVLDLVPKRPGRVSFGAIFQKLSKRNKRRLGSMNDLYFYMNQRPEYFQTNKASVCRTSNGHKKDLGVNTGV